MDSRIYLKIFLAFFCAVLIFYRIKIIQISFIRIYKNVYLIYRGSLCSFVNLYIVQIFLIYKYIQYYMQNFSGSFIIFNYFSSMLELKSKIAS